jgi:hypothetical protein
MTLLLLLLVLLLLLIMLRLPPFARVQNRPLRHFCTLALKSQYHPCTAV